MRHAKSSWGDLDLADFDRPLNDRGKKDAPRMGKRLKEKRITPDLMLSSPAKRALSTCKKIAEILNYPKERIETDSKLYHANENEMLDVIRNLPDKFETVMIFGHNPGLTDFVNSLMDQTIFNIPTCGVAACTLDIPSWKNADWKKGGMKFYDYPKSKDD